MATEAHTTRRALLCSLPALGAAVITQSDIDRFLALFVEWQSLLNRLDDGIHEPAIEERLWQLEKEMAATPVATSFGARSRLQLLRQEFRRQHYQGGHGDDLMITLLDHVIDGLAAT